MRAASRAAAQLLDRSFFLAVSATMVLMLLFGLFHQLHQTPAFFVLLGWGYGVTHGNPAASATGARSNGLAGRNE
jgi:hypothetical protein